MLGLKKSTAHLFVLIISLSFCVGCETVSYYSQAVTGQLSLLAARQDIDKLMNSEESPASHINDETKQRLRSVLALRHFARESLALPVGNTFSSYVDLHAQSAKDNYVVWNVFAAPALSIEAKSWCYPIAGCAEYRGYFSREKAQAYADRLAKEGFDTYVAGVKAYSTLGWFADPVLSSFLSYSDSALAGLIFHELAHKVMYVSGDTEFNESFATVVEREGVRRWVQMRDAPEQLKEFEQRKQLHQEFVALIAALRERLGTLYESDIPDADKLVQKTALFTDMQSKFAAFAAQHDGAKRYQGWLKQLDSNAKLVPINSYNRWVNALTHLFEQSDGDFALFYSRVESLANQTATDREASLKSLDR